MAVVALGSLLASACFAQPKAPREVTVSSDSVSGWAPTVEQEAKAQQALAAFLAAMDAGRPEAAYALTNDGYRSHEPRAAFVEREARTHAAIGPIVDRRLLKVTWSKNPRRAPAPGVYAAMDLASRYAKADRHCSYIILRQPPEGGPFQVNNVLQALLDNETARGIVERQSIAALDAIWAKASSACPNYGALARTAPLPESQEGGVGYPSVAAALAALHTQPGVSFRSENGWTIAEDTKNRALWSFAPAGHPAYPSAIKRQIVAQGGSAMLEMRVACEATKAACDSVVREFEELNDRAFSGRPQGR